MNPMRRYLDIVTEMEAPTLRTYRVVYRAPGVKRGQEMAGDVLIIKARDERQARKLAREILANRSFGQKYTIGWVTEIEGN